MSLGPNSRELQPASEAPRPAHRPLHHAIPAADFDEPSVPFANYLWAFKQHRWKILSFIVAAVAGAWIVSARLTPIYEATVTLDVDRQAPAGLLGQDSQRAASADSDQFLSTQMKLIQSDSVLRPVARKYNLLEKENQKSDQPGMSAERLEDAPVLLRNLKVNRPVNTFLLLISYRSTDPVLASDVANGIATSYLQHNYDVRFKATSGLANFMDRQLEELKAKMEASSQRLLQFERELNVINPEEKTNILSARLLQLNTEYTSAQGDRVRKEAAYNSVKSGTLESVQVSTQGESLKKLGERLNEADEKFAEAKVHYGVNHPEYKKAEAKVEEVRQELERGKKNSAQRVEVEYREAVSREQMLQRSVAEAKTEYDHVNARSGEYQAIKREADADKKLYEELTRKIKEAGINAGFQNSMIRIADPARPPLNPVSPNINLNVLLAFLISTLMASGAALVSDAMNKTVRDPEQIWKVFNTPVIGALPKVKAWKRGLALSSGEGSRELARVTSGRDDGALVYSEALRSLRNAILLSGIERNARSILVTSALPREGKSTVAANLAASHAEQGRRTLLIDADLRRPTIHRVFNLPGKEGLAGVLLAQTPWRDALWKYDGLTNLDILPAGVMTNRALDLIGEGLQEILLEAATSYDFIVLDAPPLLPFAEPLEMATMVDGVVVVARAGVTERKQIASVLHALAQVRANVLGVVLNEVRTNMSDSYGYMSHYGKYYRAAK